MSTLKTQDQGLIMLSQQDYLPILVESFLIDRKAQGLSPDTIGLYTKKLQYFLKYCERQALPQISQITSDFIRRYLLELSETHNPGGVHACFRPLRTMLYWIEEEEIMPQGWKNPIRRVKAPKLPTEPIEPVHVEEIESMLKSCESNYAGTRDKAMILGLLDTGAHAKEFLNINLGDIELATGSIMIRQGKGRKPRMVFLGRKTIRAIRAYLRGRRDNNPALWVSVHGDRMTYTALRSLLRRRAYSAGLRQIPTPHDFRRAFALIMLRNGVDIFVPLELREQVLALAEHLSVTADEVARAFFEYGIECVDEEKLQIRARPNPHGRRMTLFPKESAKGWRETLAHPREIPARKKKRPDQVKKVYPAVSYRLPESVHDNICGLAMDLDVPVGEVVSFLLHYGLEVQ